MSWPEVQHTIDEVKKELISGVPPLNPKTFRAVASNGKVKIYVEGPADTIIDGQEVCHVNGILVLRKEGGYPVNEKDVGAVTVLDIPREDFERYKTTPYEDVVANGKTYYYEAYSYSDHGVFNRSGWCRGKASPNTNAKVTVTFSASEAGLHKLTAKKGAKSVQATISLAGVAEFEFEETGTWDIGGKTVEISETGQEISITPYYYGYDLVSSEPDPDKRTSYPAGVENADFAPAYMDFANDRFVYGGWDFAPGEKFMPEPTMLSYGGVVMEKLDPNDYTKKIDGQPSSVAKTDFAGNAMMQWGKIFTSREETKDTYKFRCSDMCLDDDWDCWCNYDQDDNQIDHFYTAIYYGSFIADRLRSISGQSNYTNVTIAADISAAKANGNDWYTEVSADIFLIQDLLVLMAKSTDTQSKYGMGRGLASNPNALDTGTMNQKGLFWGSNDQVQGVKVFGMENMWGNLWRRVAGWVNANGLQKIKITSGKHDGSSVIGYNQNGEGYISINGTTPSGSNGGYISSMKVTKFGRLPVTLGGSDSTYETDVCYYDNTKNSYAKYGGNWVEGKKNGIFDVSLNTDVPNYVNRGTSLSFKPRKEAV